MTLREPRYAVSRPMLPEAECVYNGDKKNDHTPFRALIWVLRLAFFPLTVTHFCDFGNDENTFRVHSI